MQVADTAECNSAATPGILHRDGSFDRRVRIVADQRKILELEVVDVLYGRIELHSRQRAGFTGELQTSLLHMIIVKVQIAKRMNESARLQIANLRHHHREQGIGGEVEWNAKEKIRAALVKLATQLILVDEELEHDVAGGKRHLLDFCNIPRAHDQTPAIGTFADLFDYVINLIDGPAVRSSPVAPLRAVDAPKISVRIRPFIPNGDPMVVQVL